MKNEILELQKFNNQNDSQISLYKKTYFCYNKLWGHKLPNIIF